MTKECQEDKEFLAFLKSERVKGACSVALWVMILVAASAAVIWGIMLACDEITEMIVPTTIGIMK